MENSIGKVGGVQKSSKKSRSLDLQSLYKTRVPKEGGGGGIKGKKFGEENGGEVRKEEKKKRKSTASSRKEREGKKSRKSFDEKEERVNNGVRSGSVDSARSLSSLNQKLNSSSNAVVGISFSFDQTGNGFRIPKRPRGSVTRKRFGSDSASRLLGETGLLDQVGKLNGGVKKGGGEADRVSKLPGSSGGEASCSDRTGKLLSSFVGDVSSPKGKRKTGSNEVKESRNGSVSVARHAKEEDSLSVVNNGDTSSRKRRSNHRKRKDLASGSGTIAIKVEPSTDKSGSMHDDFPDDDDEENLEQNAARMLSSRFDPSCTGFSSNSISSLSPSTNRFSLMIPSGRDFVDQDVTSLAGSESPSLDTSSRILRPRKEHKDKGLSSKRRHYYEILPGDFNAYWVLNRRIKVFWPLDKRWYYGLVGGYDPERALHHIKYDDRDEEWVNLQNEKYKLLLLPGEVPGKGELKESAIEVKAVDKEKISSGMDDDVHLGNCLDSEPIITWLTRSSHRIKHTSSSLVKKQKISPLPPSTKSSLSFDRGDDSKGNMGSLGKGGNVIGGDLGLLDRSSDGGRAEKSLTESPGSSEVRKPVVYFRKRFRKKGAELSCALGNQNTDGSSPRTLTSLVPLLHRLQSWREFGSSFLGCSDNDKLLWSFDDTGSLSLSMQLIKSKEYRFKMCLSKLPFLGYLLGAEHLWLSRTMLLIQYGTIVARSPVVIFEMLFIDNIVGMRSLLFKGSLEKAVAFIFLILSVFNRHTEEQKFVDLQLPVTSIRIRLSSVRDPQKQHIFAFYSFSKLKYAKWLYLDSELQQYCLLTQQLPLSECTYDNIKALEGRSHQLNSPCAGLKLSIHEDLQKKSIQDVLPICLSGESCSTMIPQSAFNFAIKPGKLPPFAVSFTAAPTFFLSLHLQMLMKRSFACFNLRDVGSMSSLRDPEIINEQITQDCCQVQSYSEKVMGIIPVRGMENSLADASASACLTSVEPQLEISVRSDGDNIASSWNLENGKVDVAENSVGSKDFEKTETEAASLRCESDDRQLEQHFASSQLSLPQIVASSTLSNAISHSSLDGLSVEIPSFDQVDRSFDGRAHLSGHASDLTWDMTNVHSPNAAGPRSLWQRNIRSVSSPLGDLSPLWSDGKTNIIRGVFNNGPKKRRTQVQYTMPFGGYGLGSKQRSQSQRSLPYKRIRRADDKRISDGSRSSRRNLELSTCDANVLVTLGDRGWREYGARVVLELADRNEWRLAVKFSGVTKYSYKVNNILQPGSTNRYTHAMMWKGGKDWVLEFPDRSQWMLFKEMHEECYNRNVRAASVKNIPIPGVRVIEESDDCATDAPFIRHCAKYFRQVENDVDMAMNPSRVLYDMDSDDEQWLSENKESLCTDKINREEISDELFEKTMDMFEKVAYAQQRDHFTSDEIEELMVGVGSTEVARVIYEHWWHKRQRKGMPLIRHLQPPLWEKYLRQVKEWEQAVARANTAISGCQERALANEKPPMFAFCLRPRGLEIPNKGSKHRSQKKLPVSLHNQTVPGDQDAGRRFNGSAFGDEKAVFSGNGLDSSEASPLLQSSTRAFSPRDACGLGYFSLSNDVSEWNHNVKHRNKVKKIGGFPSPSNPPMVASFNHRTNGKRNGVHHWSMDVPEFPSQKQYHYEGFYRHSIQHLDGSDLQEFKLRDASGAAQHALNIAKIKRERAQKLLYRADLAIHKAVVALMTADAIKAASENTSGDG